MAGRLHKGSNPVSILGQELVSMPGTFTDVEEDLHIQIPPTNSISDSSDLPVEFRLTGTPDHYVVLYDSHIHIQAKIQKSNGDDIPATEIVTPVNLFAHAMFNQCDLYLNEELVTKNNGLYGYKAYIATTVGFGSEAKKSWLESELYYQDVPGDNFDLVTVKPSFNTGLVLRNELAAESRVIDMVFKPHIDLFMQGRPIPPNVDIRLRLARASPEFCLMAAGTIQYKIKLVNASFFARIIKLNENVSLSHKEVLLNNGMMKYPIRRVQMQSFTIPSAVLSHTRPNVLHGQLPKRIIMGMTSNKAFSGMYTKSPFRFSPFNLKKTNLIVNGKSIPSRPYTPNFDDSKKSGYTFIRMFNALTSIVGGEYSDRGNRISRKMFEDGFTLIPFTLSHDYQDGTFGLVREGSVQLEIDFRTGTTEVINVILYMEYENTISIGKHGDVHIDY